MTTRTIFNTVSLTSKNKEPKKKNKKMNLNRGLSYELTYSFFDKKISQNVIKKDPTSNADASKISELAALILCRTQMRRGQLESALELLEKFIANHGETKMIVEEKLKILEILQRQAN